jgi:periplasmic protein TonB
VVKKPLCTLVKTIPPDMKNLLILCFLLQSLISNGQKTYLDENKVQVIDPSIAKYYKILENNSQSDSYKELCYFITGEKESEETFIKSKGKFIKTGESLTWHKNGQLKSRTIYLKGEKQGRDSTWYGSGQLKSEKTYVDGKYENELITYWQNGKIKRKDFFKKDQFRKGLCFDSLGNEIKHFDYEIMPLYEGGDKQLIDDIAYNLVYPERSKNAGTQGRVIVRFVVNEDGGISSVSILEGVRPELDEEAMRAVKTLKKFTPAYQDGEPVPVFYMVPVSFILK